MNRLDDPDEHFPYKREEVDALIAKNGPMGPAGPDDQAVRVSHYMSSAIAAGSDEYIHAQEAWLKAPSQETGAACRVAAEELVAARQRHRAGRPSGPVIGAILTPGGE